MKRFLWRKTVVVVLSMWFAVTVMAGSGLDRILDKMAKRGASLNSMRARIVQKKWTDILEEFDAGEQGSLLFLRKGDQFFLRKDIETPQPNHLVIAEGEVVFYQPRLKQAQRHQLGEQKDKAEFLLVGFGTSREVLEETYQIRLLGRERLKDWKKEAYILELVPRSSQVSAFFSRIVLWVDPELWVPVQQKLVEPTNDFLLVTFGRIELNPSLSRADFKLKLPKDVNIVGK